MSDIFIRNHHLESTQEIDGGWIAECHCAREFWSSFRRLAIWKQQRHRKYKRRHP